MDFNSALEYAAKKHEGQKRKGGEDYITHPVAVAKILEERGYDLTFQVTALFHDLLEDTNATCEEILNLSNNDVLTAVKLLTKEKNYKNEEYLVNIFKNKIASVVKMADRYHNLQCAIVCDNEFKEKYIKETITYYYPLIKGKEFEKDIINAVNTLANTIK